MFNKSYTYFKEKLLIPLIVSLSIIITLVSFGALVLTVAPIQVLEDWKLTTDMSSYTSGSTINIRSQGYKKYSMAGDSARTLVCMSGPRTNTYDLNTSINPSVSKGDFDLNIPVTLPVTLEALPRTCRIDIDVDYPWYGFKASGSTNDFQIKQ